MVFFILKDAPNTREVVMANKVSKTTRKRTKNLKKVKRLVEVNLNIFLK